MVNKIVKLGVAVMLGFVPPILSPTIPPPEYVQPQKIYPKSVDEILRGKKFIQVCSANYEEIISKGKVVLFVYNQGNGIGYKNGIMMNFEHSKAMAEVFRRVVDDFPAETGIRLLKFDADCNPQLRSNMYKPLTEAPYYFYGSPYVIFFENGEEIDDTANRAPSFEESVMASWIGHMRKALKSLQEGTNNYIIAY